MCCINLHLIINRFTFNTDYICKLLYMICTYYQNKTLHTTKCFQYNFYAFVVYLTHTQNSSKVKLWKLQFIQFFFQAGRYSFILSDFFAKAIRISLRKLQALVLLIQKKWKMHLHSYALTIVKTQYTIINTKWQ